MKMFEDVQLIETGILVCIEKHPSAISFLTFKYGARNHYETGIQVWHSKLPPYWFSVDHTVIYSIYELSIV